MGNLEFFKADVSSELIRPFADGGIYAGFPSPPQDTIENSIDLNKELVKNPLATFYARVVGDSMQDANVQEGDIIVIDRKLNASHGSIVVACLEGEFTIKKLDLSQKKQGIIRLVPANKKYKPIEVLPDQDFTVWGVVTYVIHKTF